MLLRYCCRFCNNVEGVFREISSSNKVETKLSMFNSFRLCRKNRSTCSIRQLCFDVVAGVDGALVAIWKWKEWLTALIHTGGFWWFLLQCLVFCIAHRACWLRTQQPARRYTQQLQVVYTQLQYSHVYSVSQKKRATYLDFRVSWWILKYILTSTSVGTNLYPLMPILFRAIYCNGVRGPRAGRFVRFWASGGAKFTKMGVSQPWTQMNRGTKFDAASFIIGGVIRNCTKHRQTDSKRYIQTLPIGMCG